MGFAQHGRRRADMLSFQATYSRTPAPSDEEAMLQCATRRRLNGLTEICDSLIRLMMGPSPGASRYRQRTSSAYASTPKHPEVWSACPRAVPVHVPQSNSLRFGRGPAKLKSLGVPGAGHCVPAGGEATRHSGLMADSRPASSLLAVCDLVTRSVIGPSARVEAANVCRAGARMIQTAAHVERFLESQTLSNGRGAGGQQA